jgi:hypothetical protein
MAKQKKEKKAKGKGLFGGFFRNLTNKNDMDIDTTGVNESYDVSPDNSLLSNAMDIFSSVSSGQDKQDAPTHKAFLGLESAKKNEKKTTMIMIVAGAIIILLFLFMKKK